MAGRAPRSWPALQKVDFVADEAYEVTRSRKGLPTCLNKVASAGYNPWTVNATQSIFGKTIRALRPQGGNELHGVRPSSM